MTCQYLRSDGVVTTATDPEREMWYSASGECGYWTDDWTKLKTSLGIPCCPECGCPGMQSSYAKWESSAEEFEKKHPRYTEYLAAVKETCSRNRPDQLGFMDRYKEWLDKQEPH